MEIQYRQFRESDLDCCVALAVDAWPIASVITEGQSTQPLMRAYVKLSLLLSDYSQICCTNDKVIGFLFGLTHKKLPGLRKRLELNKMCWEFIVGKYGKSKHHFRFLVNFAQTLLKVEFYCFKLDSEVELFVVDKEYRGRGIGRSLIGRFIEHLKERNKKTVYLYTNIVSNWRFYEKCGFIKYRSFYDNQLSFLKGTRIYSHIYYYRL